jgi:uncharacterized protein involved in exopolysaccharide biosynthesis
MDTMMDIDDVRGLLQRRKKIFMVTFLFIFALIGSRALILPSIYRSQATILIEAQQIPENYVTSTLASYAEERLDLVTRHVMSRSKLLEVIKKFNLYPEKRDSHSRVDIVKKMSSDITLETILTDVINKRTGKARQAITAFTLAFKGKDPTIVQRVTNELASLYLKEEAETRERLVSSTTAFFEQEAEQLKKTIQELENEISQFKKAHVGDLPEHNTINFQRLVQLEEELKRVNLNIRTVQERRIRLKEQSANVDPRNSAMDLSVRLQHLRLQLISLRSTLSERHPDIKQLKREIEGLENQVEQSDHSVAMIRRLTERWDHLGALKTALSPKHPDVVKLSKEVELMLKIMSSGSKEAAITAAFEEKPDNPAYVNLKTQIATTEVELNGLHEEKRRIKEMIARYQKKIENSPLVEKEYNKLTRDYNNAKQKYSEIMSKFMEAKIAQGMVKTQRGERFTIIEPAHFPEKPYKPNRMAILLIGFVLALGAGIGLVLTREMIDTSIKTPKDLRKIIDLPVLSVLPLMQTDEEQSHRRIKRILIVVIAIGVIVGASSYVHRNIMPLDPLWAKIQSKLMTLGDIF